MAKILQKYTKFSSKELEQYAANPESCVICVKTDLHLSMGPYGMANFKHALHELLIRTKVGIYDANLNGIVLGIKNIKVLGQTAGMRADDPTLHLLINAEFYVLRPAAGAVLHGVVQHVSRHQISAIIYRVFNTIIRFTNKKQSRDGILMDQEIRFRITDFNISTVMPYIEGELLLEETEPQNKSIKFEDDTETIINNGIDTPAENGAETHVELDALVELIKMEPNISPETTPKKKKAEKPHMLMLHAQEEVDEGKTATVLFPVVTRQAPHFEGTAVVNKELVTLSLSQFAGKYVVLLFYGLDFSSVYPTEVSEFSERQDEFLKLNAVVIACSVDSPIAHLTWLNMPGKTTGLGNVKIPLLSDLSHNISKDYGVYMPELGHSLRAQFIIDARGILRHSTVNDMFLSRSVDETLRLIKACRYADITGVACPTCTGKNAEKSRKYAVMTKFML
ncbi:hypothetical protein ACLKA6_018294 [Drosophila palustris]